MALPEVGRMPASISKTLPACSLLAALYMLISHPCITRVDDVWQWAEP